MAKAYSFTFTLDSSPYTELFVSVPCADYDLVLGLPWLRKHNPDINWEEGTLTMRPDPQSLVAVPAQGATALSPVVEPTAVESTALVAVPVQGATALSQVVKPTTVGPTALSSVLSVVAVPVQGATALFSVPSVVAAPVQGATALSSVPRSTTVESTTLPPETSTPQGDEDPELWPLNVDSQDYTDLPDDAYASEIYKQRLASEKITFAGTTDTNHPAPMLPEYLQDFADVFSKDKAFELPPHRPGVDHAINLEPGATPPNRPVFRQSEAEIKALKEYLEEFQKCGFIRKSTSPCAAPTLYVPKPGTKDLRLCVDYRGLNTLTIKNRYPLPLIDSLLDGARKAKFYTKLDLRNAYHLIRIKEGDEWKTAFKTIFGLFEYQVMPFGLTNAPASFQAYVDSVLEGMNHEQAMAFLDDILIMGETREELGQNTREVLRRLRAAGLYVKLEKCYFEVTEVPFLGFILTPQGVRMDPDRISTVMDWPEPERLRELQSFLGFGNFYRRFIREYSRIAQPMTRQLRTANGQRFQWTPEAQAAFQALKKAFTEEPCLRHFDPEFPIIIEVDASGFAMAAILYQEFEGRRHPVAFWSRKMSPAEENYGTPDQELLAMVKCMEHWRHYLEGAKYPIMVRSDQDSLRYFNTTKQLNRRQARWSLDLQKYDFVVVHRPGKTNPADAPSRRADYARAAYKKIEDAAQPGFLTFAATQISTNLEGQLQLALPLDELAQSILAEPISHPWELENGILYHRDRVYVPEAMRLAITAAHHDTPMAGHYGITRTLELITREHYWPHMRDFIDDYVTRCQQCARNKPTTHATYGALAPLPVPEKPWSRIGMDLITDLPLTHRTQSNCILVVIDAYTKMAHFVPTTMNAKALDIANLLRRHVVKHHGVPKVIVSDRDKRWLNDLWKNLCERLSIQQAPSSAYRPSTDGQTERVNTPLESYLRAYINYEQDDWDDWLDLAEFAYNNSRHATTGVTPFFANYGRHPEFTIKPERDGTLLTAPMAALHAQKMVDLYDLITNRIIQAQLSQAHYYNKNHKPITFKEGDWVWLRTTNIRTRRTCHKLDRKKIGPFQITKVIGTQAYRLVLPNTMAIHDVFHVSLLEPAKEPLPGQADQAPEPIFVDGEKEHEVQAIVNSRCRGKKVMYKVRWEGYGPEHDTWEPLEHLAHAPDLLESFHYMYPDKPRPAAATTQNNRGK